MVALDARRCGMAARGGQLTDGPIAPRMQQ